jgi:hypothetical protein
MNISFSDLNFSRPAVETSVCALAEAEDPPTDTGRRGGISYCVARSKTLIDDLRKSA